MDDVHRNIAGVQRAHAAVIAALRGLTDAEVGHPSRLPGWTVGHVATHIARNAEGHVRMCNGAMRGEVVAMYPGGREQRTNDIEAGANRPAVALADDVAGTAAELEATWAAMTDAAWSGHGSLMTGEMALRDSPFIRWREVIVHHADLGIGYSWAGWDDEYVRVELAWLTMQWASRKPMGLTALPAEAMAVSPHRRVAWLLGRDEIDGLGPAEIIR